MGVVIDTSVLVNFERSTLQVPSLLGGLSEPRIASITISELIAGIVVANTEERRSHRQTFLDDVIATISVLPFGVREAQVHGTLHAQLRRAGTPIGERDLIIAATALANGHSVMTNNLREFERVPGLDVLPGPRASV